MRPLRLLRLLGWKGFVGKKKEDFAFGLAKHVPRWLRYYVAVWCVCEATSGPYEHTVLPELTCVDMLERVRVRGA